jgi:DNA invertase Pin-like site-specific DNA recombinase
MAVKAGRAVGYTRVSTEGQGDSGLGLQAQGDAITACCLRLGVELVATYTDVVSGGASLESRPALADALLALRSGDVLVVAKLDRLARDSFNAILIEREVGKRGATIVSCAGEGNGDDPAAVFTRRILAAVAELERSLIAARTRSALAAAKARGRRTGHLPYGWRVGPDGIHLERHPGEVAVLREIHRLRDRGFALVSIAEELMARGFTTRHHRPWTRQAIGQLLDRHPTMLDCPDT